MSGLPRRRCVAGGRAIWLRAVVVLLGSNTLLRGASHGGRMWGVWKVVKGLDGGGRLWWKGKDAKG